MTTQITFISDSQTIKGTVTYRTAYDLAVRIDQPYSGFTASRHIASFGRQAYSFDREYGDQVQIALLKGLYDALSKLENQNNRCNGFEGLFFDGFFKLFDVEFIHGMSPALINVRVI